MLGVVGVIGDAAGDGPIVTTTAVCWDRPGRAGTNRPFVGSGMIDGRRRAEVRETDVVHVPTVVEGEVLGTE